MTIEQAKATYEELCERYEERLAELGLRCESEIYLEDDEFDITTDEAKAVTIELDLIVYTDNMDKDDAYGCCTIADIKDGRVSDASLKEYMLEFEETLDTLIEEISLTGDAEGVIRRENEKAEADAEEMMQKFERDIKMTNRIALIAVGVCVVAAAVALIMHFLL